MAENHDSGRVQNIILESRKKLSVSGVDDVDSFDENQSIIYTCMGLIEVKGKDIHMSKLNLDSGEIILEGNFDSVQYIENLQQNEKGEKRGILKRLLQ